MSLEGEARNAAMRLRMVLAGFTRYGEMEQVGESGVAFACGMPHDALMRVLLPYSRNISSVETMMAAEALQRPDDYRHPGLLPDVGDYHRWVYYSP